MLIIWVDDGLVCSNNNNATTDIIVYLGKCFAMRSTSADHFVGLTITRNPVQRTIYVNQPDYAHEILKRFYMSECHPKGTPADPGSRLRKDSKQSKQLKSAI